MILTSAQRKQFVEEGYLVIDQAVEPALMEPLRAAAARVTEKTRSGIWPHKGANGEDDIWGVGHLLHPDLGEPVFAEYLASAPALDVATELLGPALRLSLVNMLVNPAKRDFPSDWHRDQLKQEVPPEEEEAILARLQDGVQWNAALYDEACLLIVPGSHRRAATPEEREIQFRRPLDPMPGEMAVQLAAGQGVYHNAQILHRGRYPVGQRRETLHACLHRYPSDELIPFHYHFVRWMETPGFRATLPERLLPLHDNWLHFAEAVKLQEAAGQ
jgi:ectoine hydroxylase-related dioxygenase (phytanoyl-CoA dioxygenase family)